MSSLLVSFGSEFLVDPTPIQAVALPSFTLLVAAWSVADDEPAFLVLAVITSYLMLTHLAMLFAAPFICSVALLLWLLRRRRCRHDESAGWADKQTARRKWAVGAVVATIVLWTPTIYEQLTSESGNITQLVSAATHGGEKAVSATWSGAFGVVTAVVAAPPFWLPPNFRRPPFDTDGGGQTLWLRVFCATVFIAIVGATIRRARAAKDDTIEAAAKIGIAGLLAWVVTWRVNPGADNLPIHYFWGVWPLAAFLWLVIGVALFRTYENHLTRRWTRSRPVLIGCACTLVVATSLAAFPQRNNCGGRCASSLAFIEQPARETRAAAATFARSHGGPILIDTSPGNASVFLPALLLGLQDADVEARVTGPFAVRQYGAARSVVDRRDARFGLTVTTDDTPDESATLLGTFTASPMISPERYDELNRRMTSWTSSGVPLTRIAKRQPSAAGTQRVYTLAAMIFAGEQHDDRDLDPVARFITALDNVGLTPNGHDFDIPDMSPDDLTDWARERDRRANGTFHLYATRLG